MIRLILVQLLAFFIAAAGLAGVAQTRSSTSPITTPPGEVQVRFSRPAVYLLCPCMRNRPHPPEWATGNVRVSALVKRENTEPLNYTYAVTGGRIIGLGPNVTWDFNDGWAPGKYSITVVVDNGLGTFSSAVTESITFEEADCHCPCQCPSMSVVSHKTQVKRGEKLDFEARVHGGHAKHIGYRWSVENGVILSGQGTPSIEVRASSEGGAALVTASLEVGLDYDCGCQKVVEESVQIGPRSLTQTFPVAVPWLVLDESTITLACPRGYSAGPRSKPASKDAIIDVDTYASSNSRHDKLSHTYSVMGGNIIGSGPKVKWDLTGLTPGTYEIGVVVADAKGSSDEKKQTITIVDGDCGGDLFCPNVSTSVVQQRIGVTNDFIVQASISGGTSDGERRVWKAEGAEIIAGQGSDAVRVRPVSMNPLEPGPLVTFILEHAPEFSLCNQTSSVHLWIPDPK